MNNVNNRIIEFIYIGFPDFYCSMFKQERIHIDKISNFLHNIAWHFDLNNSNYISVYNAIAGKIPFVAHDMASGKLFGGGDI